MLSNILKFIWMKTNFFIWEKDNLLHFIFSGLNQVEGRPLARMHNHNETQNPKPRLSV